MLWLLVRYGVNRSFACRPSGGIRGDGAEVGAATAHVRAHVESHADYWLLALVANAELHALSPEAAGPALALREQSRAMLLQVGDNRGLFTVDDAGLASIAIGSMGLRVANCFGSDQPYTRDQVADAYVGFA